MMMDWLQDNTFWCGRDVNAVLCVGLLQARAILAAGLLLAFMLCLIGGKLKRQSRFAEARFSDHRQSFAHFLSAHLRHLTELLDIGSTPLPLGGPLAREDWQSRALLPQKLRIELDKLLTMMVAYNASLQKNAHFANSKTELSAVPPADMSRNSTDVKKQLIKCQKMATAVR